MKKSKSFKENTHHTLSKSMPDFEIKSNGKISDTFLEKGISTFKGATTFIQNLTYGRNLNKKDLATIFIDNCGTCSTKHAILKQLADENNFDDIKLILSIVKMDSNNTPEISKTLMKYNLDYIPEAHNYLKFQVTIFDFTKPDFTLTNSTENILAEIEISPNQITDYKVAYHKKYLEKWLEENPQINFSIEELWEIRENCIMDLASI